MCSCDYSALESRLGADIYNEQAMLDEFLHGGGDMHSLCAKMVFTKELEGIEVKDVKHKRPDLRKKVKAVEFAKQFGGSSKAISDSLGCTTEEADVFSKAYDEGFKGVTAFAKEGSKNVRKNGYVLICEHTGHKMWWWDHKEWLNRQKNVFTSEFWDKYREIKAEWNSITHSPYDTPPKEISLVRYHFAAASKWDRMALNAPTQGSGIIILKDAMTQLFNYIVDNNYFNVIKLCDLVHDEAVIECPKDMMSWVHPLLEKFMFDSAAKFCKSLPIPAVGEVGNHWIH
jgi:DNA polymerase I-like protein with 3'-5' exonuclease and polymerase domains